MTKATGNRAGPRAIGEPDSRAVRQHGVGRVCAGEGCRTILSRYNDQEFCSLCQVQLPGAARKVRMPRGQQAKKFSTS